VTVLIRGPGSWHADTAASIRRTKASEAASSPNSATVSTAWNSGLVCSIERTWAAPSRASRGVSCGVAVAGGVAAGATSGGSADEHPEIAAPSITSQSAIRTNGPVTLLLLCVIAVSRCMAMS
jgi:hypothetical protein